MTCSGGSSLLTSNQTVKCQILAWLPELLPNDSLLAAALDEFLSFDAWIEGRVGYSVQCKRHPYMIWPTLSDIICTHDARFSRWVDLDKARTTKFIYATVTYYVCHNILFYLLRDMIKGNKPASHHYIYLKNKSPSQTYAREKYRAFAEVSGNWKAIVFKFLERGLKVTTSQPPPTYIAKTVGMMFHEVNSRSAQHELLWVVIHSSCISTSTLLFNFVIGGPNVMCCDMLTGRYQGIRDVHRRLKYAINIQIMIVKLFIGDLQQRSKVYTIVAIF